jgi:hypothetical protein
MVAKPIGDEEYIGVRLRNLAGQIGGQSWQKGTSCESRFELCGKVAQVHPLVDGRIKRCHCGRDPGSEPKAIGSPELDQSLQDPG